MRGAAARALRWAVVAAAGLLSASSACMDGTTVQQVFAENVAFSAVVATRATLLNFLNALFACCRQGG